MPTNSKSGNASHFSKRFVRLALACLLIWGTAVCASRSAAPASDPTRYSGENQVELYGRHRCSICRSFVAQLEARRIDYRFYDLDREAERASEMWALIREHHPETKSVGLPVVRVNGAVLIRPDFSRFETYLKIVK